MLDSEYDFDDAPVLNVMQIVALNVAASGATLFALRAVGSSWTTSVLGGWLGGSVATIAIIAGTYWLSTALSARNLGARAEGTSKYQQKIDASDTLAPLVPSDVTDPLQVWEADRLLELDNYIAKASDRSDLSTSESVARTEMEQMWHDDAAAEAEEARLARDRRAYADRRQASGSALTPERRTAQRRG